MPRRPTQPKATPPADLAIPAPHDDTHVRPVRRRAAGEGTIYREGKYWVVEVQWTNELGTHRRRRKRKTRTAAVAARDALVQDIRDGAVAVGPEAQTTVAKALENYLVEAKERVCARTYRDYSRCVNEVLNPALGRLRAHMLRRKDVTRMVAGVSGARSKQFAYVLLKAAIAPYVRAVGPIDHPFPPRSTPHVPKHIVPPFDHAGIARILNAIRGTALEVFVVLALASGLRQSELLGLTWGDVREGHLVIWRRLDEYTRTLGATKTDGGRRRNDLPAIVMRALENHRKRDIARGLRVDEGDYLFRNRNGEPIDASNLRRSWRSLRVAHDLPPLFRLYDLRHAHASLLAEAGVSNKVIAERLGHASTRLTDDTYSHLMPGMQSAASAIVGAILDQAASESPPS